MKYLITISDTSPKYGDIRNPDIHIGDIEVKGNKELATAVYDAILVKYPSRDIEVSMYFITEKSETVCERKRN